VEKNQIDFIAATSSLGAHNKKRTSVFMRKFRENLFIRDERHVFVGLFCPHVWILTAVVYLRLFARESGMSTWGMPFPHSKIDINNIQLTFCVFAAKSV